MDIDVVMTSIGRTQSNRQLQEVRCACLVVIERDQDAGVPRLMLISHELWA